MSPGGGAHGAAHGFGQTPRPRRLCHLERLVAAMEARGLDGVLSYYSRNVLYLSGYASGTTAVYGEANGVAAVVVSRHRPEHPIAILPDFEAMYFVHQPTWVEDIRLYRSVVLPFDVPTGPAAADRFIPARARGTPWIERARQSYTSSLPRACAQALRDAGLEDARVGFDNLSFAPLVAAEFPRLRVADAYGLLKFVRMVKTDAEIALLREAHRLNETAINHVVAAWTPGMSWNDLTMAYYLEAVRLGGFIFDRGSVVLFNPLGSEAAIQFSTGLEEDFPLRPGMHVMFDCHGRLNNYNWDGGKTWIVGGEPTRVERDVARACGDATAEVLNAARPGARLSELQTRARQVLRGHRLPAADAAVIYFHGVGLDNSELEWGAPADWSMEPGMVVAAHILYPGDAEHRYYIEEIGVVRPDGMARFFSWSDHEPLTPGAAPPA
jgi:Xaa-Pro dipeptidase